MVRLACVLLVDRRGRVLLQERDEHAAVDPEKWGLVGGHVEDGEDYEPAAYRELEEETGVVLPPGALRFWREVTRSRPDLDDATFRIWCAGTYLDDADIVVGEGRQIVFVDPARIGGLDLADLAEAVLPEFLGSADYRALRG
ncbi:NUDIX domain-containing protein [Nocardioides sp. YIM 152315]|uniref:NUDIX domain-containing protein n=1 Tax=Nocardioides sp. YIM 152315 TaxID=3031760 RepID=UPI0023D9B1A6|nr:NUDIX domain-containing protein [Nocardioides sp. YIM 152315]MDF1606303.1 NUDIX domain-containing protein [Nocardioides sp. YIM 152315]